MDGIRIPTIHRREWPVRAIIGAIKNGIAPGALSARTQEQALPMSQQYDDDDTLLVEKTRPKLQKPPMFKVVLLNDDYTPMEFVVHILESIFGHDREKATQIMLHVHTRGKGVCGTYTRDVAETKVVQVNNYARENEHPLLCDMEEA